MVRPLTRVIAQQTAATIQPQLDAVRLAVGSLHAQTSYPVSAPLSATEFKVFSQFNEDGIVQHLCRHVPIVDRACIEFGVEDYRESNTRFLVTHDNWRALILDGGDAHVSWIRSDSMGWRHAIEPRSVMLTRENINDVFTEAGFVGDIGLLSIDVDGVDYWLLDAINVVSPRILIVEYNSTFGPEASISVPYDPAFRLDSAHSSRMYFGASLTAIVDLAVSRGYRFVGCESHGCNAFFVRDDVAGDLPVRTAAEAWVPSRFMSSRDEEGNLTFVSDHRERLRLIRDCVVVRVPGTETATIGEVFGF
jgi:hypothetical protein